VEYADRAFYKGNSTAKEYFYAVNDWLSGEFWLSPRGMGEVSRCGVINKTDKNTA